MWIDADPKVDSHAVIHAGLQVFQDHAGIGHVHGKGLQNKAMNDYIWFLHATNSNTVQGNTFASYTLND